MTVYCVDCVHYTVSGITPICNHPLAVISDGGERNLVTGERAPTIRRDCRTMRYGGEMRVMNADDDEHALPPACGIEGKLYRPLKQHSAAP